MPAAVIAYDSTSAQSPAAKRPVHAGQRAEPVPQNDVACRIELHLTGQKLRIGRMTDRSKHAADLKRRMALREQILHPHAGDALGLVSQHFPHG